MKLLTKTNLSKVDKSKAKIDFSQDKLVVNPLGSGNGELNFPLPFSCFKFINVDLSAKKTTELGSAKIGVTFVRRGVPFGPKGGEQGFIPITGDGYKHYELHFLIPFGVDEAFVTVMVEGGAALSVLELTADVSFTARTGEGGVECVSDGGLSAYAPKNSTSAILAGIKAGYTRIIIDADMTLDGELIAYGGENLSSCSDGEGYPTDYTFEQLQALDFGFFANPFYKNTRVMRLEDAIKTIANAKASPLIRVTVRNFDFLKLSEILEGYAFKEGLAIISPDTSTLEKASAVFPDATFGYIGEEITADRCERLSRMKSFIVAKQRPANYARAEECGIGLMLTANDEEELIYALSERPLAIITGVYQLKGCKF